MRYSKEELNSSSKVLLIKVIEELYNEIDELKTLLGEGKPKGAIHFGGSPDYIKRFHDDRLKKVRER